MHLSIGNAPCSWGVEFADDPRNPPWTRVLDQAQRAGYCGIELGPIGFMPEDPAVLAEALAARDLTLIGGVVFRPFHDPTAWDDVKDATRRTCKSLKSHGARHLVLIDSISAVRAPTAGRPDEAKRFAGSDLTALHDRLRTAAKIGTEEYGLTVSIHAHAGGYVDFKDELVGLLEAVDESILKICLDTGHSVYAGFDPVAFLRAHGARVSYLHFKDVDPDVQRDVVANRVDFYDACARGLFCNLGEGAVDFAGVKAALEDIGFDGWGTVEQDCAPDGSTDPVADATANLNYLKGVGLA